MCGYEHAAIPHRHRYGEEEANSISRTIYANRMYLCKMVKYLSQYVESYCSHFPHLPLGTFSRLEPEGPLLTSAPPLSTSKKVPQLLAGINLSGPSSRVSPMRAKGTEGDSVPLIFQLDESKLYCHGFYSRTCSQHASLKFRWKDP